MKADRAFANAFLAAFGLDVALTLVDGAARLAGVASVAPLRDVVGLTVCLLAPALLLVALLSSRLPRRALLPLALGTLWVNFDAPPLGAALGGPGLRDLAMGALQASFALPGLDWIRRRGGRFFFAEPQLPPFRRRFFAIGLGWLAAPLAYVLLGAGLGVRAVERETNGFIGFGADGICFDQRHYQRDDGEVVLIGMSHVGAKGVYRSLLLPDDRTPTLVLEEGVTDEHGLLPGEVPFDAVARELGLDVQPRASEMLGTDAEEDAAERSVTIEDADIDVSAFRPTTIEFLRHAFPLIAAPGDPAAWQQLSALTAGPEGRAVQRGVVEDVLVLRNRQLLDRIEDGLARYPRVVVPWGVAHLPALERDLLARGFALESSEARTLLTYRAIADIFARIWRTVLAAAEQGAAASAAAPPLIPRLPEAQ